MIFLEKCINTLKLQTHQNFEIVFVDDCSTDNSSSYITDQIKINPNIRLIQHIYNQGTCLSRCHAILSSKGNYIMSIDPDDEYLPYTIEKSYQKIIKSDADILEYDVLVCDFRSKKKFIYKCKKNFSNITELLINYQEYRYFKTNWNIWKRIIKRSVYLKAINLFYPFIKNKKICNGEDILHCGTIYLFINKYICGDFLGYIYYKGINGSSFAGSYYPAWQSGKHVSLSIQLSKYFYANRNNLSKCSLEDFLSNKNNLYLYNIVKSVERKPIKNCSVSIPGLRCSEIKDHDYYIIEII